MSFFSSSRQSVTCDQPRHACVSAPPSEGTRGRAPGGAGQVGALTQSSTAGRTPTPRPGRSARPVLSALSCICLLQPAGGPHLEEALVWLFLHGAGWLHITSSDAAPFSSTTSLKPSATGITSSDTALFSSATSLKPSHLHEALVWLLLHGAGGLHGGLDVLVHERRGVVGRPCPVQGLRFRVCCLGCMVEGRVRVCYRAAA